MKTTYVLIKKSGEETNKETLESIQKNNPFKIIESVYDTHKEYSLNDIVKKIDKKTTHVCLIENNSILKDNSSEIVEKYIGETENEVRLPLVEYWYKNKEESAEFKGFLNSCIWKPLFGVEEVGEVDIELAKRGFDLTLSGAIIPISVLNTYEFKNDTKYYSALEYIVRLKKNNVEVKGIPKITMSYLGDFELKSLTKEEKTEDYNIFKELSK